MPMKIVILEDNDEQQRAMQHCLEDRFHQYEARFFAMAREMINYLQDHLHETIVISLDHDLEVMPGSAGALLDTGTGREVADYLASLTPVCPVIIHTTNSPAAVGMDFALQEAHWATWRVVPHDDLEWINEDWFPVIRPAIVGRVGAPVARVNGSLTA